MKTRTGINREGKPFLCVASLVSTIHLGNTSLVPIRDSPSLEFVNSLCKNLEVQVLFGGEDFGFDLPCPIITNGEILAFGGASSIDNSEDYLSFVIKILEDKYPIDGTPEIIYKKALSFIKNEKIRDSSRCTLICSGQHEGLTLYDAHRLAKILTACGCHPRVLTVANGLSINAPDEDPLEVNADIFPSALYDYVDVVAGVAPVYNTTARGTRRTNIGSNNTVKYLIGHPRVETKEVYDLLPAVPDSKIISVAGTLAASQNDGSDDKSISPLSFVLIVQAKFLKQLIEDIEKLSICSYDVIRATVPGRWAFISILPRRGTDPSILRSCFTKDYVFLVPSSLAARSSRGGGVGLLKVVGNHAYAKNHPVFIDHLNLYKKNVCPEMVFFPLGDSHVRIILGQNSDFEKFAEFLKQSNTDYGHSFYSSIHYDGKDHHIALPYERVPMSFGIGRNRTEAKNIHRGNFIIIHGLPLSVDTSHIV